MSWTFELTRVEPCADPCACYGEGCPNPGGGGGSGGGGTETPNTSYAGYFVMSQEDQRLYPEFTNLVKNMSAVVESDSRIMEGLQYYTGLSREQILANLKFGSGPEIKIAPLSSVGQFNPNFPNTIFINDSEVQQYEQRSLFNPSYNAAMSFFLAVSILHEHVHYGDKLNEVKFPFEAGNEFENRVWGVTVDQFNAYYLSIQSK